MDGQRLGPPLKLWLVSGRASGRKTPATIIIMDMSESNVLKRTAKASPGSDACHQPPVDMTSEQGVPRQPRPRLKKLVEIRFGSWNVGSMTGKGRELVEVCRRRNIDILCVQETKWKGKSARELGEGYKMYYSGEGNKRNGVGIILSPKYKERVIEIVRPTDRLIMMKLVISGEVYNVISAYAPQVGESEEAKDEFMEGFEDLILNVAQNEKVLVGADLNGHVGQAADGYQQVHGGKGYGQRNREGERILECAESLNMALVNTFYEKSKEHLITYKSGGHATQIDYVMVKRADLKSVKNCKVIPGEEAVAQHRLLCAVLNIRKEKPTRVDIKKKIKIWKLKGEKVAEYRGKVREKFDANTSTVEENWQALKTAVLGAATEVCGTTKGGKHQGRETWWWNEDVQEAIKRKKGAFKAWQKGGGEDQREAYRKAKNEAKRAVAKAKEEAWTDWYTNMETEEGEKVIYKVAKQRAQTRLDIGEVPVIRDQNGTLLTEEKLIKDRWREYFNTLLNVENDRDPLEEHPPVEGPILEVSREEVGEAMQKMKSGKAAGGSGLPVDLLKHLGEEGEEMVYSLLQKIWREEEMPKEWELSEIVTIYKKKGDPMECGNFRGIKLLEHAMKMFEKVLEKRLRSLITIDNMQFGFSPGKGTTDAVFIIKQLQEKHLETQRDLFFTFVDLEKAYDRIPRDLVYWCLRKRNVPEKLVRLVQTTYHGARTVVRTKYGKTDEFNIRVGLHQGSGLSPFLFTVVLDVISEEYRGGLPWELLFADDLALMADSEEELQRKWLCWQNGMESKGLKVNITKTEVMVSSRKETKIDIKDKNNISLKQVSDFKYLGVTLNEEGGSEAAVRARVTAAWAKWRDLSSVINDKRMPRRLKTKLYSTIIRPVLLYGAEVWTMGRKEERLLEATEMRMLRRIKGVTLKDKERSENIRKELGVNDINEKVKEIRMRWYGHVLRMDDGNPVKEVMHTEVEGKRPRGRPRKRWKDNIKGDMHHFKVTPEDAQNKHYWRTKTRAADPAD